LLKDYIFVPKNVPGRKAKKKIICIRRGKSPVIQQFYIKHVMRRRWKATILTQFGVARIKSTDIRIDASCSTRKIVIKRSIPSIIPIGNTGMVIISEKNIIIALYAYMIFNIQLAVHLFSIGTSI